LLLLVLLLVLLLLLLEEMRWQQQQLGEEEDEVECQLDEKQQEQQWRGMSLMIEKQHVELFLWETVTELVREMVLLSQHFLFSPVAV
jgi:predicted Holliday junction resolvase-like endonuclease